MPTAAIALQTAALATLTVLAALLPFEIAEPAFKLGPLSVTNVELILYLALVLGLLRRLVAGGPRWGALHYAVLAFSVCLLVSGATGSGQGRGGLKFALRGAGGCGLFFAVSDLAAVPGAPLRILSAAALGAAVSAGAGVAEACVPAVASALQVFRTSGSSLAGFVRASGTLQYTNLAALFWGAALPLALACGSVLSLARGRAGWRWFGVALSLVLSAGVVLTLSRAGLVLAVLTLLAMAVPAQPPLGMLRAPAGAALLGLVGFAALDVAARPDLPWSLRLRLADGTSWPRAHFQPGVSRLEAGAGAALRFDLRVSNAGAWPWPARGPNRVEVCHDWAAAETALEGRWLELRCVPLARDVAPGETATLAVRASAPPRPGRYTLRWHLAGEQLDWWSARDAGRGDVRVDVQPARAVAVEAAEAPRRRVPVQREATRRELWRAAFRMWAEHPLLGVGPDNFRHLYAGYLGPKPLDERTRADSLYLETLADLGVCGFAALGGVLLTLGAALRQPGGDTAEARVLRLGVGLALCVFLLHGLVADFLEPTAAYGLFWILAGLASRAHAAA